MCEHAEREKRLCRICRIWKEEQKTQTLTHTWQVHLHGLGRKQKWFIVFTVLGTVSGKMANTPLHKIQPTHQTTMNVHVSLGAQASLVEGVSLRSIGIKTVVEGRLIGVLAEPLYTL